MWFTTGGLISPGNSLGLQSFPRAPASNVVYACPRSALAAPRSFSFAGWGQVPKRSAIGSIHTPVRAAARQREISYDCEERTREPNLTQRQESQISVEPDARSRGRARLRAQHIDTPVNCKTTSPTHRIRTKRGVPADHAEHRAATDPEQRSEKAWQSKAPPKSDANVQFTSLDEHHLREVVASLEYRVRSLESLVVESERTVREQSKRAVESERSVREESVHAARETSHESTSRSPPGHKALAEQAEEMPLPPKTLLLTGGASSRGRHVSSRRVCRRGPHGPRIGGGDRKSVV